MTSLSATDGCRNNQYTKKKLALKESNMKINPIYLSLKQEEHLEEAFYLY